MSIDLVNRKTEKVKIAIIIILVVILIFVSKCMVASAETISNSKIHILALNGATNAILLESNGHFAVVDSGEDTDYPENAVDGVSIGIGFEKQVMSYLKQVGVNNENFDFYIGTHSHSDHIGSADEIIREFKPKKVLTPRYDDSYIRMADRKWDNQYIYNRMINAAKEVGSEIILDFNESNSMLTLGDLNISLLNIKSGYGADSFDDANEMCFVVNIEDAESGKKALIGSDVDNFWSTHNEKNLTQKVSKVDLMVLAHHGYQGSNTYEFIRALSPDVFVLPNADGYISSDYDPDDIFHNPFDTVMEYIRKGSKIFAQGWYHNKLPALVFNFDDKLTSNLDKLNSENYFVGYSKNTTGRIYARVIDGKYQELPKDMFNGSWVKYDEKWYFKTSTGRWLKDCFAEVDGNTYYFDKTGIMQLGWKLIDRNYYYFDESGAMLKGLHNLSDGTYYFYENGIMTNHDVAINGILYKFADSGRALNGFIKTDNKYMYYDKGVQKTDCWIMEDNKWYYIAINGYMKTGRISISDVEYYLRSNGEMAVGWIKDSNNGKWYYANSNGALHKGWKKIDNNWYYLDDNKEMVVGKISLNDAEYYLKPSGEMVIGWIKDSNNGKWYYANSNGALHKGWKEIDNRWYYLDENSEMVTGIFNVDGRDSYFYDSGEWRNYL